MNSEERCASQGLQNKGAYALFQVPMPVRNSRSVRVLRVVYAVVACTAFGVVPASAQPEVIRCLPPEAPMTELPVDVLAEYRTEIAAEFEAYFSSITEHIACLDDERIRALAEARDAADAYATFLNIPPAQKDLP